MSTVPQPASLYPVHTPAFVSSRLARMTVAELRAKLADLPDWAEVRLHVPTWDGPVETAVWDLEYSRGLAVLVPDENDPTLPRPMPQYYDVDELPEDETR
ncbi:hypothetical protein OS965_32850 [Streptomyces sp. H27-G5]|uniref:hypothetical protein n=1 Tax=Streptomyces sp. H27-G5 TaxID=2996698 RepID=UPI002271504A|nr:hypothetical protein [Streptomyces sp. H27-G5]MCY0922879.1 hypothetical protein [Streptomyces sp. H27-G5]